MTEVTVTGVDELGKIAEVLLALRCHQARQSLPDEG